MYIHIKLLGFYILYRMESETKPKRQWWSIRCACTRSGLVSYSTQLLVLVESERVNAIDFISPPFTVTHQPHTVQRYSYMHAHTHTHASTQTHTQRDTAAVMLEPLSHKKSPEWWRTHSFNVGSETGYVRNLHRRTVYSGLACREPLATTCKWGTVTEKSQLVGLI